MSIKKILISTAEASGDQNGANLVKALLKLNPLLEIYGMGGAKLREVGMDLVVNSEGKSVVGLLEALPFFSFYLKSLKTLTRLLDERRPDLLLLIDSQGFNLALASEAKKRGIKTAYFFAPQEWHWGTRKGLKKVAGLIDLIVAVFKKEELEYKSVGANAIYFGHPLVETAVPELSRASFYSKFKLNPRATIIGLLPGNRKQEIAALLPLLLETAKNLSRRFLENHTENELQFIIPVFSPYYSSDISSAINKLKNNKGINLQIITGHNYEVLAYSNLIICSPGTAALEAAILGTPTIVTYKLSALTYFIAKSILRIKIEHFTMPNFIAEKKIIPEFIQNEALPDKIAAAAMRFIANPALFDNSLVKRRLGSAPVISKIAEAILS